MHTLLHGKASADTMLGRTTAVVNRTQLSSCQADEADISGAGAATATLQRVEEPGAGMAMALSFGTNVALFCAKLTSAVLSGSLSIIASALDSFLDLLSNLLERATSAFADIVLAVSLYCTQKTSEPPDIFF